MAEPISRRAALVGSVAILTATAFPTAILASTERVVHEVPDTLPALKRLSEQAMRILEKHFPHHLGDGAFLAEADDNYHGLRIRCDCPDVSQFGCTRCCHPLEGTPMVGGMSCGEEPEWDERTAYEELRGILEWSDKPEAMPDDEWLDALALVGMTAADHAGRLAWMDDEFAEFDDLDPDEDTPTRPDAEARGG